MALLDELRDKRVLILGLGREGLSTLSFLREQHPDKVLGLADRAGVDELDEGAREIVRTGEGGVAYLGPDYLTSLRDYEVIFKSPGISPFLSELILAAERGAVISSNTELFFECCPGTIIGITGTKGKGTTTSAILDVLRTGGLDARLAGNIGIPPLSTLAGATARTIFVTELSSHQLMGLRRSPHIAVLQNVVREHLDYYPTFEEYVRAKRNIALYQGEDDYVIFNSSYPIPTSIAADSPARKIPFGLAPVRCEGCFVQDEWLMFRDDTGCERIMPVEEVPLRGRFNLQNVMPAIVVGKILGIPGELIAWAISSFKPLEHRLEIVGSCRGVTFCDDAIANIPEATLGALEAFHERGIILVAGGRERGQEFTELARAVVGGNVRGLVLMPGTGARLWEAIVQAAGDAGLPAHAFVTTMREVVERAYELAGEGDVVLLSPAAAFLPPLKDGPDRGLQFKAEVRRLTDQQSAQEVSRLGSPH